MRGTQHGVGRQASRPWPSPFPWLPRLEARRRFGRSTRQSTRLTAAASAGSSTTAIRTISPSSGRSTGLLGRGGLRLGTSGQQQKQAAGEWKGEHGGLECTPLGTGSRSVVFGIEFMAVRSRPRRHRRGAFRVEQNPPARSMDRLPGDPSQQLQSDGSEFVTATAENSFDRRNEENHEHLPRH